MLAHRHLCRPAGLGTVFLAVVASSTALPAAPDGGSTALPAITVDKPKEARPAPKPQRPKAIAHAAAPARSARATSGPARRPSPASVPAPAITAAAAETSARSPGTADGAGLPHGDTSFAPAGQTQTVIGADRTANTRAFSVTDLLVDSPGVALKQGNGPRDIGISIRGSNARNGFGIRNIVIFDDGFPVTQPDGLSRTDLIDPHAYGRVDVIRGPSSALFGNYATGGAIDFRTRPGGTIDGLELGTDAGSFRYVNNYLAYGRKSGIFEGSVFASSAEGDAATSHSLFDTQTVNALATITPTPDNRFTFKFIENHLRADLSDRVSLNQFYANPYQRRCATSAVAALGCANVSVPANGFNGASRVLSAQEGGFGRNDNRAIFGARFEHDFSASTTWRTQVTVDDRNINQPTGATSAIGDYPSLAAETSVTSRGELFGFATTHYAAAFVNTLNWTGLTYNVAAGGNATLGGLTQIVDGHHANMGARGREEVRLTDRLTFVTGVGVERTALSGSSTALSYVAANVPGAVNVIPTARHFLNTAPEAAFIFQATDTLQVHTRAATGYGTPQLTNLFVTPAGLIGSNTQLKSQSNIGLDVGADWTPATNVKLSVAGFYEFFRNELLTQSPGPSPLQAFTFNAPRSEHRGVETALDWRFRPGFHATLAYSYDNQIYTDYTEQLSAGALSQSFDRRGNRIPGVPTNELLVRLGYDQPDGPLKGAGAYVEYVKQDSFFVDNANLLKAPGYDLVNLNLHYSSDLTGSSFKSVLAYFEIRNITNRTYVASANNVSDSLNATTGQQNGAATVAATSGSIYAGTPRSFFGGVRLKF